MRSDQELARRAIEHIRHLTRALKVPPLSSLINAGAGARDLGCISHCQPAQLALVMVSSIAVWTSAGRSMCGMCPAPSSR
jgi:hypothetical protein